MELALDNSLTKPGAATVLGTPVDLSKITVDSYVVAGIADHITPWQNAYRTVNLLGSEPRFVLSTSGHIAALVNPPGNEKASYRVNDDAARRSRRRGWRARARRRARGGTTGTAWLGERSGGKKTRAQEARRQGPQAARRRARAATCKE